MSQSEVKSQTKKILIVDDDPVVRILIDEYLSTKGFSVTTADTGKTGLDQLSAEKPDIVVLDLFMPDMTGVEVLKRIRENPATANLPVLMLSANTETEEIANTHHISPNQYLHKPFEMKEILRALEGLGNKE